MSEEIVACPACAKKFRIPDGAPGGTFQCTACDAAVPYGKQAKVAAPTRGGAPAPRAAAAPASSGAPVAGRGGRAKASAKSAKSAGKGAKGARGAAAGDEPGRRDRSSTPEKQWALFGTVALVLLVGVVIAVVSSRKSPEEIAAISAAPAKEPAEAPPVAAPTPAAAPPVVADAPPASGAPAASAGTPGTESADPSGIGAAKTTERGGTYGSLFNAPGDELFVVVASLPDMTPEERAAADKDTVLFADRDSGRSGTDARNRLKRMGRKAIPSLISQFSVHWKGSKWEDDGERFASYQIQRLLAEIVKADRPGGDFFAKHGPGISVPAADFQRAARMWTAWWLGQGHLIDKFKEFAE